VLDELAVVMIGAEGAATRHGASFPPVAVFTTYV
jgi:hypothetical protein